MHTGTGHHHQTKALFRVIVPRRLIATTAYFQLALARLFFVYFASMSYDQHMHLITIVIDAENYTPIAEAITHQPFQLA